MGNCSICKGKSDSSEFATVNRDKLSERDGKELLSTIQKEGKTKEVTKIQAHIRGHQERKKIAGLMEEHVETLFSSDNLAINNDPNNSEKVMVGTF